MELQNFLFKYGIDTTTNFDLINIAKDLGLDGQRPGEPKIKILMRDELELVSRPEVVERWSNGKY